MTLLQILIFVLLVHFCADFLAQTQDQSQKKGEGKSFFNKWLFYHVGSYTIIWTVAYWCLPLRAELNNVWACLLFSLAVFIPHYTIDWVTSRVGKPFWKGGDYTNGFSIVGFDQILHYLSLFLTIELFTTI